MRWRRAPASTAARRSSSGTVTISLVSPLTCCARPRPASCCCWRVPTRPCGATLCTAGTRAVFTPNPIAAGIPTSTTPFLIDISSSITTNGMSARLQKAGRQFDQACMLDAEGNPSRDPGVLSTNPPGTIMPLGGMSSGHKGFGLALLVEALTGGLAGHGRADPADGWGATVFMSLYDPAAFGGTTDFLRQTDWLGDACRSNPPRPGFDAVRMPGDRALSRRKEQECDGIMLHPTIPPMLAECAQRYGMQFPAPLEN